MSWCGGQTHDQRCLCQPRGCYRFCKCVWRRLCINRLGHFVAISWHAMWAAAVRRAAATPHLAPAAGGASCICLVMLALVCCMLHGRCLQRLVRDVCVPFCLPGEARHGCLAVLVLGLACLKAGAISSTHADSHVIDAFAIPFACRCLSIRCDGDAA